MTAFNGRSITYDAIGNPLTYYNGTDYTMTWEQGRRLSALHTDGKTVSYRYDSEGKRTGKTADTGQTEYIYAGGQLVSILGTNPDYRIDLIYDESGVQSCIYTAGTAAPVTYYLIKNAQGDVMQLRDEADTIVANYAYDAFGRLLSVTDIDGKAISDQTSFAHRNPLRYRGYLYDSETGFYYLSSRYYDPKIRRFINADSQLNLREGVVGYNLFAYCNNNPIIFCDKTGTDAVVLYDNSFPTHLGIMLQNDCGTWYHFYWGTSKKYYLASICQWVPVYPWCLEYEGDITLTSINAAKQYKGNYSAMKYISGDFSASQQEAMALVNQYASDENQTAYNLWLENCSQMSMKLLSYGEKRYKDIFSVASEKLLPHGAYQYVLKNITYSKGGRNIARQAARSYSLLREGTDL